MTVLAWLSLAAAAVSSVWFIVAYKRAVGGPGALFRAERHHLMASTVAAFTVTVMLAVYLGTGWPTRQALCLVAGLLVTLLMVGRIRLLHRAQQRGKHRDDKRDNTGDDG